MTKLKRHACYWATHFNIQVAHVSSLSPLLWSRQIMNSSMNLVVQKDSFNWLDRDTCKDGNVVLLEWWWHPDNDPLHFGRDFSALRHSTMSFMFNNHNRRQSTDVSDRPKKSEFQYHNFMTSVLHTLIALNVVISLLYFLRNSGEYSSRYCEFIYRLLFLELFWAPPTSLQNTISRENIEITWN